MQSIAKQRRAFEKELFATIGPALRGTGWKKSGQIIFRQSGEFFQDIEISVFLNEQKIRVTQRIKPMTLDVILWNILGMPENARKPLSFRSDGAFTCLALPIDDALLDSPFDTVSDALVALKAIVDSSEKLYHSVLTETDFSTLLTQHTNQRERGAYAVTLVTSLINDGDRNAAADLATAYDSGELRSCMNLSCDGVSFHRLALDWLAREHH
ncbi:MAG: hypothetical protein EON58_07500 [Alphaproteobacteria bacterium]|nr:MAG: hypothetical protein EON58_07500 [Alphaproteobacteria bacterium]